MSKLNLCVSILIFLFISNSSYAEVIAKAGSVSITDKEFNESYEKAVENSLALNRPPTKKEHLEDMIRYRIGLQEAKKINLQNNPLVKQALELELYKGLLEVRLANAVEKINVSESDMKSYYSNNPEIRSSQILISYPVNANKTQIAEARSRALKIYKDVSSGQKKWDVYTRMYSDDTQTKNFGGDMGYHSSKSIHPKYYETLKKLKMGQVSPPVQGVYGFHIIKKTGIHSYERANKNAIKVAVFDEKRFKIFDKYFQQLKQKYSVSVKKDFL